MEKKRVLIVGPSSVRSKGGMATVIEEIQNDKVLREKYEIEVFESYIDGNRFIRFLFAIYAFIKFCLTKRNYDLYHVHMASRGSTFRKGHYIDAIKKWNKKVILHIHGAQYLIFYDEITEKQQKRVVEILKKSDLVLALSQDWKDKFDKRFGLTNCCVLENGINVERFISAIQDPELHQRAFLMLGRLGQRKGTYDLVEAIDTVRKTIPDIKCYLAGDGDVERVRELVKFKSLENNIEVVGWANFDKKLELLSSVAVVVLPSYNEGLPIAILEAMSYHHPIISTPVGGIPEVVTHGENGILVSPGNSQEIADAIKYYIKNPQMIKKEGDISYHKVKSFFPDAVFSELNKIYSALLK